MSKSSRQPCAPSRREFLRQAAGTAAAVAAAGALGFPTIVPSTALGRDGAVAPSERVVMGWVGTGGQGRALMSIFKGYKDVQVVAVCDVDGKNRAQGLEMAGGDAKGYKDFRELVGRDDIDAVCVATPDHWHAVATVAALDAGKDVYCEKPLANSVGESRAIVEAVKRNGRVLQVGSMERSNPKVRRACELVRNGRIGKVHTVRINLPDDDGHLAKAKATQGVPPEQKVPEWLDWNLWLGHTPKVPYNEMRCHFWWRFILAHGGGEMTDRGAHVIDLAELGLGYDTDEQMPTEYEATGRQNAGSLYDAFWDYKFTNTYPSGVKMIGSNQHDRGLKFEGDKGWIFIEIHGGKTTASDPNILKEKIGDNEIQLGRAPGSDVNGHRRQFIDGVKTRRPGFAPAEVGARTATICHLNNLAMKLGKKLVWDPKAGRITNDESANPFLTPPMREPWKV